MVRRLWIVLVLCLSFAPPALAQTRITTGVIEGSVVDASGAVLPGVVVEARNVDTNLVRSVVTGREDRFALLSLPPGRYTVTFKLSGFATLVQEDASLTVGQAVRINAVMKLSGVAETVTVTTQAPAIETSNTASSTTLNQRTIETTPILGRKFEDMLGLTPASASFRGLTETKSRLRASGACSTTSASTAATTTTGSSVSRWAGSGRPSTSRWMPSRSSRWWRRGPTPSTAAPRAAW